MNPLAYTAIATVAVAIISVVGTAWYSRRPQEISGAKEITESALLLVKPQSDRINELIHSVDQMSKQVDGLSRKIMRLERHIDILTKQIIDMGAEPVRLEGY